MKGKIKTNTVDRYLAPVRKQLVELVPHNATVLELGCGNGDLLFKLAPNIAHGTGLDFSAALIEYANQRKSAESVANVTFERADLTKGLPSTRKVDVAIASLLFHVLPWPSAVALLKCMRQQADRMLLCGFTQPASASQRFLLWLDQRFNKHYRHFKEYQQRGYMQGLLAEAGFTEFEVHSTFDPVIIVFDVR